MELTELIKEGERLYHSTAQRPNAIGDVRFPEDVLNDENYESLILWREKVLRYAKTNCDKESYDDIEKIELESNMVHNGILKKNLWKVICKLKVLQ